MVVKKPCEKILEQMFKGTIGYRCRDAILNKKRLFSIYSAGAAYIRSCVPEFSGNQKCQLKRHSCPQDMTSIGHKGNYNSSDTSKDSYLTLTFNVCFFNLLLSVQRWRWVRLDSAIAHPTVEDHTWSVSWRWTDTEGKINTLLSSTVQGIKFASFYLLRKRCPNITSPSAKQYNT